MKAHALIGRKMAIAVSLTALIFLVVGVMLVIRPIPQVQAAFEPFSPDSPFRTRISNGAVVDPNSAAIIAYASRDNGIYSNMVEFGIPIYSADAGTPRYTVGCTMNWGQCPFEGIKVPIPDGAGPNSGSDGVMVIVDESTRQIFEFWQAAHTAGHWTTSWGAVNNLDGSGWGGNSTGSGASRLAGVIRVAEIQQGDIPHALAMQSNNVCAIVFRSPAIKSDGSSFRSDCIREGTRIRLDPTIDLSALDLAPAVRTVAQALQVYGGYIMDHGGAPLSISFELDRTASNGSIGNVYQQSGLRGDYDNLPGIPWDRLQILA